MRTHVTPTAHGPRRRFWVALVALSTALLGATLPQTGAAAGPYPTPTPTSASASITGAVLGVNDSAEAPWDDPLPGVPVTLVDTATSTVLGSTVSDELGRFELTGLAPGTYTVRAELPGWTPGESQVTVGAGEVLDLGEIPVYALAAIQGQVLGNFDPLGDATVTVLDAETGQELASVVAGASGDYRIDALPPYTGLKVRASKPGWTTDFANHQPDLASADEFVLSPGVTLTQQFDPMVLYLDLTPVHPYAGIQGVVTGSGAPLAGVTVELLDPAGTVLQYKEATDDTGTYAFSRSELESVVLLRFSKAGWSTVYADGVSSLRYATRFTMRMGEDVIVPDLAMARVPTSLGAISGTVVAGSGGVDDPQEGPLSGARVTVVDASTGAAVASVRTDALGAFRVGGLPGGQYKVRATSPGHLTTFATGKRSLATADVLTLAPGEHLQLPEPLVLVAEAILTGTVMGFSVDHDDPLGGVTVTAIDAETGRAVRSAVTGGSADLPRYGVYRITGLPAGTYKLRLSKPGWLTTYAHASPTLEAADAYTVVAGQTLEVPGPLPINGELVVAGTVTGLAQPIAGALVTAYSAQTGRALRSTRTDSTGAYRLGRMEQVPVKIRAAKAGWLTEFAVDKPTLATADVVDPYGGAGAHPQVDVVLTAEAAIEGQVLGNFDPLGDATVTVLDATTGAVLRSVRTDGDGYYRVGGLAAGTVKVRAAKADWFPSYADGERTLAAARVFTLVEGETLRQQWTPDLVLYLDLTPAGVISGSVRGVNPATGLDAPLTGATVRAVDAATGTAVRSVRTGAAGEFRLTLLPEGRYKVRASLPGYVTTFAVDAPTLATADTFVVSPFTRLDIGELTLRAVATSGPGPAGLQLQEPRAVAELAP